MGLKRAWFLARHASKAHVTRHKTLLGQMQQPTLPHASPGCEGGVCRQEAMLEEEASSRARMLRRNASKTDKADDLRFLRQLRLHVPKRVRPCVRAREERTCVNGRKGVGGTGESERVCVF